MAKLILLCVLFLQAITPVLAKWSTTPIHTFPRSLNPETFISQSQDIKACNEFDSPITSNSLNKMEVLLKKMNDLFGSKIKFLFDADKEQCELGIPTFQATGDENNEKVISVCRNSFELFDRGVCGKNGINAIALIIAHEFAHHLLGYSDYDYDHYIAKNNMAFQNFPMKRQERIRKEALRDSMSIGDYIDNNIAHTEHEYVDALASKILKSLGYGPEIQEGISCMDSLFPNFRFSEEHKRNRVESIKLSYTEGWSEWKSYKSFFPVEEGLLKQFLRRNNYNKTLNSINLTISDKEWEEELTRRLERYKSPLIIYH